MNKKIFTYTLLIFIALFGFNMNVKAAQELTCLYEGYAFNGDNNNAFMLMQDSDGTITIWKNEKEDKPSWSSNNWIKTAAYYFSDSQYLKNNRTTSRGNASRIEFTDCPKYSTTKNGNYYFYDGEDSTYWNYARDLLNSHNHKLYDSSNKVEVVPEKFKVNSSNYLMQSSVFNQPCDLEYLRSNWLASPTNNYINSCLYYYNTDSNCRAVQVDFNTSQVRVASSVAISHDIDIYVKFNAFDISDSYGGMCPINIFVSDYYSGSRKEGLEHLTSQTIYLVDQKGFFSADTQKYSQIRALKDVDPVNIFEPIEITNCSGLLSEEIVEYLNFGIKAIKIAVPLILIALGIVDFARGVFSTEDDMKKIQQKFIKRVILALAFFLIPTIIGVLLDIAENVFGITTDLCGLSL